MKKKFSKILGVALTLVLVSSLFAFAVPVSAAEGDMQWGAQPLPTATNSVMVNGSVVTDIAVANDGVTIYAINNGATMTGAAAAPWCLYKSTNAGQSWTGIDLRAVVGATADPLGCVAVAPDDPNAAAISNRDPGAADVVFITKNGGISWIQLPAFAVPGNGVNADVMDIDVSAARSGTLYDRDYLVAIADELSNDTTCADVQTIGGTATWASVGNTTKFAGTEGLYDYMACAFSPTWVGDRTVAVVGADNVTIAGAHMQILNVRTGLQTVDAALTGGGLLITDLDTTGPIAACILAADIALPSDWDPTAPSGRRTYCSTASVATAVAGDNDSVYRVDAGTVWDLSVGVANIAWESISYSGTIAEGTLFAGAYAVTGTGVTTNVKYATDPQLVQPAWRSASTPPTGQGEAVVRVDPGFTETGIVFVGTSGANESAFSVSYNSGTSYQQESLIDAGANNVVAVDDIALTPDGGTLFVATNDTAELSLWKSATPVSPTSWSRMYCTTATGPGVLAVNPGYAETPALILTDTLANGIMYVSVNGGDTYARRYAPVYAQGVIAVAMQDADVVYVAQGTSVYKSTDSCAAFGAPNAAIAGVIISLDASAADLVLVGGTGACSYSTDGAATFARISTGLPAAGTFAICADSGYADNNLIYAANTGAVLGLTYRYDIDAGGAWTDLGAAPSAGNTPMGVASGNGVLYSMDNALAVVTDGCNRNLTPAVEAGVVAGRWDAMSTWSVNPAAAIANFTTSENHLYCATGAISMWAYNDYLATATTTPTLPKDGTVVSVDPVSGRAMLVTLAWDAMGTGTGLVNVYHILLAEAGTGFTAPQSAFLEGTAGVIMGAGNSFGGLDPTSPSITVEATTGVWNIALNGGTAYEWMVRAFDSVSLDSVRSGWSAVGTFSVAASTGVLQPEYAGPILQAPQLGAQGVSITPGFDWAPIPDAVKYEFELSTTAATTARGYFIDALVGLTGDNALVTPGWQCDIALDYDTSYFWHVKSIAADGAESIWGSAQFTTIAEAAVPVPPAPPVELPAPVTPAWIWAIVAIGAVLVIVVVVLIVVTRRP